MYIIYCVCVCLQTVRDNGAQCVKSLYRNRKELCSISLELPSRDTTRLTEVCHTQAAVQTYTELSHIVDIDHPLCSFRFTMCVCLVSMKGKMSLNRYDSYLQLTIPL